jgi:protein-S-isoprenylcysteine O-methyltransferase Ste14
VQPLFMTDGWAALVFWTLACYLLVMGGYGYRIRVEERGLAEDLGDEYRGYMRRTKRLIPFLL